MNHIALPKELQKMVNGQPFVLDNTGRSGSKVLIFEDTVLKIQPDTEESRTEYTMMNWLDGRLPVPKCLYYTVADGVNYLLMSKIGGKMACDDAYLNNPEWLIRALAQGLKRMWQVDASNCPVIRDLQNRLAAAEASLLQRASSSAEAEPQTFGNGAFPSPHALLDFLSCHRPSEDLVLSHGDFCLPNVFIDDNGVTGFIDLAGSGVSDRWQDIALCYRSLKYNLCGIYSRKIYSDFNPDFLFEALEMEPDWEKLNFYILLDELF